VGDNPLRCAQIVRVVGHQNRRTPRNAALRAIDEGEDEILYFLQSGRAFDILRNEKQYLNNRRIGKCRNSVGFVVRSFDFPYFFN
jgi:hypothetical protein